MAAICKYNNYCEQLSQLHDPTWTVPLPAPLPMMLDALQNDPMLMQDVWITPSVEIPGWLGDAMCEMVSVLSLSMNDAWKSNAI